MNLNAVLNFSMKPGIRLRVVRRQVGVMLALAFFSMAVFFCFAGPYEAQAAKKKRNAKVTLNLPQNLVLKEFIKIISAKTNTVFVYQEQILRGQMSITAPPNFRVSAEDAFFFFEKILKTQGLAMVRRQGSNVVEIVPAAEARFSRLPITGGDEGIGGKGGNYVMRLIPIRHGDLKRVQAALQPIFSKTGVLLVYEPLEVLMVIDAAANVERIVEIIDVLDVPQPEGLEQVVTLHTVLHNDVAEIHKTVSELFTNLTRNGKPYRFKLLIEKRLNSLFIVANQEVTDAIVSFIEQVDVPVQGATTTIHELRYSDPGKIVPLLTTVFPKTASIKFVPFAPLNALVIIANPVTSAQIIELIEQLDIPRGDLQVKLHPLTHASAKVLAPLLSKIFADRIVAGKGEGKTAPGSLVKIIAESRLNALIIIADRIDTERVMKLVDKLDVPQGVSGETRLQLVKLKYTSAKRLAPLLSKIFSDRIVAGKGEGKAAPGSPIKIIEETRLNALIIIADRMEIQRIIDLIEQLDVFQESGKIESNFKLYKLQHAVAKDLAQLLKEVTGKITEVARKDEQPQPGKGAEGAPEAVSGSEIQISADESTNTLLIFAPADTFETLDKIIAELDVPRMQVYVEALVMEVTLSKSLNLGINWKAAAATSNNRIITGGFPIESQGDGGAGAFTSTTALAAAQESTFGYLNANSIWVADQEFFSFGAFINATRKDSDVNILANPQILMMNNEEAVLNVSSNIPTTPKTVIANQVTTTQFEFKDVGVKLTIRPQISGENSIRLEISQESSQVSTESVLTQDAITTYKRELKTSIVAGNDEIVVLGGLINEAKNRTDTRVPGFSDLPLIGWMFGTAGNSLNKTNLLLFIRPTIIRNQQDLIRVTQRARNRYEALKDEKSVTEEVTKDLKLPPPESAAGSASEGGLPPGN